MDLGSVYYHRASPDEVVLHTGACRDSCLSLLKVLEAHMDSGDDWTSFQKKQALMVVTYFKRSGSGRT